MATLDRLNRHLRPNQVRFGTLGLNPTWTPRSDYCSQRCTTHWQELATVKPWAPTAKPQNTAPIPPEGIV